LTSIPSGIFDNNTATTSFNRVFTNCIVLATVPSNLFRLNILSNDFGLTLFGCPKLQLNRNIFYSDGEQTTRFLNKSVDFTSCFNRNITFTGLQGEAPDLWDCDFGTGTATKTDCFAGAGNDATSISNYALIPTAWGGPL